MASAFLENIYYDVTHPASYSGASKLYQFVKHDGRYHLTLKQIKDWLKSQETYTVYKRHPLKYPTEHIIPQGLDKLWDSDLADFQAVSKYNDGYRFICIVIDIFSRYLWAIPLKNKTTLEMIDAFQKVFNTGRKPEFLRTDNGKEYTNASFQTFLKKNDVHHYTTNNEGHANYAERVIRTLKNRIYKIFYKNQSYRYIDDLEDIVKTYNSSIHSTIKMKPENINATNAIQLWMNHYLPLQLQKEKNTKQHKSKFTPGDRVRITNIRGKFPKDYHQKFSEEYFVVKYVKPVYPRRYKLQDLNGEEIKGTFYEPELQAIIPPTTFKIKEIIRTKGKGSKKQALVSWLGYPPTFDSWIPYTNVTKYKK